MVHSDVFPEVFAYNIINFSNSTFLNNWIGHDFPGLNVQGTLLYTNRTATSEIEKLRGLHSWHKFDIKHDIIHV